MTQSRKQARRQAAKARRRHYVAMRNHLDTLEPNTFAHMCAWTAYQMRERFIRPLYAERPQWEPPPGRSPHVVVDEAREFERIMRAHGGLD